MKKIFILLFSKILYAEFIYSAYDYFSIVYLKEFIFDYVLPVTISLMVYFCVPKELITNDFVDNFSSYVINFLAIIIGFTITCVVLLISMDKKENSKLNSCTKRKIHGVCVSIHRVLLSNFVYIVLFELFSLLYNVFMLIAIKLFSINPSMLFAVNVFLVFHVIFNNIRNVSNFYFVFSDR